MTEFEIGGGGGGGEDDTNDDLDYLFETFLADDLFSLDDANNNNTSSPSSPSFVPDPCASLSIVEQIEEFLFNDDDDDANHPPLLSAAEGFLSDVLLDSPLPLDSGDNLSPQKNSQEEEHHKPQQINLRDQLSSPASLPHEEDEGQVEGNPQSDADPIAKKRKRQLRNRDAAIRSRERKKMYVKDLELKSRYYESECRRLGMLLQCYLAENHALRLSLHNNGLAFDASTTTKQESAVLLLESLLLGSLLWFLGIIGLLILPRQSLSIPEATGVENVGRKNRASLVPRKAGSEVFETLRVLSFMVSKRCRGSRRRMRPFTKARLKEPGSFDVFFFLSVHDILIV